MRARASGSSSAVSRSVELRHNSRGFSRIRQWIHNTAQLPSSACQAGMRTRRLLPQGPVCLRAPDFSAPQPPGVRGGSGPTGGPQRGSRFGSGCVTVLRVRFSPQRLSGRLAPAIFLRPKACGWTRRPSGSRPRWRRGSPSAFPPCRSAAAPRPRRCRRPQPTAAECSTNWPCRSTRRA